MAPFYGRGSTASRLLPLQGGSLKYSDITREFSGRLTSAEDLGYGTPLRVHGKSLVGTRQQSSQKFQEFNTLKPLTFG